MLMTELTRVIFYHQDMRYISSMKEGKRMIPVLMETELRRLNSGCCVPHTLIIPNNISGVCMMSNVMRVGENVSSRVWISVDSIAIRKLFPRTRKLIGSDISLITIMSNKWNGCSNING